MIKHAAIFWSFTILAVVGLVVNFMYDPLNTLLVLLIPLLLVGIIVVYFKRTRGNFVSGSGNRKIKVKPSAKTMAKVASTRKPGQHQPPNRTQRKQYPFQVIEGSKDKKDDQLPKYH